MRKVYLEGVLGEKYGAEWNLAVNSPAEALTAIMAQRPGMRQFIIDGENVQGYEILIGEDSIQTPEELVIKLVDYDQKPMSLIDLFLLIKETYPIINDKDAKKYSIRLIENGLLDVKKAKEYRH